MQTTIYEGFRHDAAAAVMRDEQWSDVSPDAEKQQLRRLTIIDGLVSVTQQAWGVQSSTRVRRDMPRLGG